jgi:uncharacterized membrane protein YbhN (UPF0104 family)
VVRVVLIATVVVLGCTLLARNWNSVLPVLRDLSPLYWVPAALSALAAMACATQSWRVVLGGLGAPILLRRSAPVFLVGQLGKYVPGSLWAYLLQVELGRRAGVARARVATATLASALVAVVATLVVSVLAVPAIVSDDAALRPLLWAYALVPLCLVLLHPRVLRGTVGLGLRLLGKTNPLPELRGRTIVASLAWAVLSSFLFGLHVWLLAYSVPGVGVGDLARCTGTMAAAMIAGLVVLLLPSGLGVREVVMYAGLVPLVGPAAALAITAVSRGLLTLGDFLAAAVSAAAGWRDLRAPLAVVDEAHERPDDGLPA